MKVHSTPKESSFLQHGSTSKRQARLERTEKAVNRWLTIRPAEHSAHLTQGFKSAEAGSFHLHPGLRKAEEN